MDFSGKSQNAIFIQTHLALKILLLRIESHLSTFQQVGNLKVYCFMQELIKKGANVSQCNKLEETPIDRAKVNSQNMFKGTASMICSPNCTCYWVLLFFMCTNAVFFDLISGILRVF